jgi:hypothetical protein
MREERSDYTLWAIITILLVIIQRGIDLTGLVEKGKSKEKCMKQQYIWFNMADKVSLGKNVT